MPPSIKQAPMSVIKQIIKEYSEHDLEAFNTRTELFRIARVGRNTREEI